MTADEFPREGFPIGLLAICLFGPPTLYFGYQQDYVLAVTLLAVAISAAMGFKLGLLRMMGSLLGAYLAVRFAPTWGREYAGQFSEWFGTTGLTNRFLAIACVGIGITLAMTCVGLLVARLLCKERPRLDRGNRWLGFLTGGGQGVAAMLLLLGGVLTLEPIHRKQAEQLEAQVLEETIGMPAQPISQLVFLAADKTNQSLIGPTVNDYNPFERVPALNQLEKIQQTAIALQKPSNVNQLLNHPEIVRMQAEPAMKAALQSVRSDPEVKTILESGEPLNRQTALRLLSNPAIMALVDQPGFVATMSRVLDDVQTP